MTKFGLYCSVASPPDGAEVHRSVQEMMTEVAVAEASGFNGVFFGEHHQDRDGFIPSPLILAAAVAARTHRIDVGTSILLLPLHHPVKVAEDVTTIDLVSSGRMILGVGIGYQDADFELFQIPKPQRVERLVEGIEILRKAWSGQKFSHQGKYWPCNDISVTPRPIQEGGPPVWIAGIEPPALKRAARIGDAWVTAPTSLIDVIAEAAQIYRDEAATNNRKASVVLMRDAWIGPNRAIAQEQYESEIAAVYKYARSKHSDALKGTFDEMSFDDVVKDRLIFGDPSECIEQLKTWQERVNPDYVILRMRQAHSGGPSHELMKTAIAMFGEKVIPHFQSAQPNTTQKDQT